MADKIEKPIEVTCRTCGYVIKGMTMKDVLYNLKTHIRFKHATYTDKEAEKNAKDMLE